MKSDRTASEWMKVDVRQLRERSALVVDKYAIYSPNYPLSFEADLLRVYLALLLQTIVHMFDNGEYERSFLLL